jgi:hypothetical protein
MDPLEDPPLRKQVKTVLIMFFLFYFVIQCAIN